MPKKYKVLFIDQPHPYLETYLIQSGVDCVSDVQSPKNVIENIICEFDGLVLRSRFNIDETFISKAKNLIFIAREGVGLDHIAVDFAQRSNIKVFTSPEASQDTVGEHTIGMLLCLLNNIGRADFQVKNGMWMREGNRGIELKGKTVGILGYGNMGQSFAKKLQGFDTKVFAYDKFKTNYGDDYASESSLEQFHEESEILSIHIPYFESNHYFINDSFLNKFKKNIYLINTARGLVLNTEDLIKNLKTGKVKGAALDVIEYEDVSFDKFRIENLPAAFTYLVNAPNVLLTPHIAGWSHESKEKHARVLAEKIGRHLFGY